MFAGPKKDLPSDAHPGFWEEGGENEVDRYGIHLLSNAALFSIFQDEENKDSQGKPLVLVMQMVICMMFSLMCLARNRNTEIKIGEDEEGKAVIVTSTAKIPEPLISTWDVGHTVESFLLHQKHYARLHRLRMVQRLDMPVHANPMESDFTMDAGVERLLQMGALSPGLGWIGSRTVASRLLRLPTEMRGKINIEEFMTNKHDETLLGNKRYPIPSDWSAAKDNSASALCLLFQEDSMAEAPATRLGALAILLRNSPKAIVLLESVLKRKRENEKVVIFCAWPLEQIYIEALLSLAGVTVSIVISFKQQGALD